MLFERIIVDLRILWCRGSWVREKERESQREGEGESQRDGEGEGQREGVGEGKDQREGEVG